MKKRTASSFVFLVLAFWAPLLHSAITVDRMFSDGMVLQREQSVPVWGTADAGESVTIAFREQSNKATAGKDGKWSVKLDALKLGPAAKLTVSGKANKVEFKDVLVGEVWVGSGQSNMAGGAGGYAREMRTWPRSLLVDPISKYVSTPVPHGRSPTRHPCRGSRLFTCPLAMPCNRSSRCPWD